MLTKFGQIVVGAPGSGKTTYCKAMAQMLRDMGRKVEVINLDPANDNPPYKASVDINRLQTVQQVMDMNGVGPNGALVSVMEFLMDHLEWLLKKIRQSPNNYFLIDFPGQIELYSHRTIIKDLIKAFLDQDFRLCSVFMVDSHYANDPGKFISTLLVTLNSMLNLECPTVNVLSKIDQLSKYGDLDFGLDFYTDVLDLDQLVEILNEDPVTKKYTKLNSVVADIISQYGLVSYVPMSVENRESMQAVMKAVDKANGYVFGSGEERNMMRLLSVAVGAETEHDRVGIFRDVIDQNSSEDSDEEEYIKMITNPNVKKAPASSRLVE